MMHDVEMVKNDPTKRLLQQAMQMDKVIKFEIGRGLLFVQYGRFDCCLFNLPCLILCTKMTNTNLPTRTMYINNLITEFHTFHKPNIIL